IHVEDLITDQAYADRNPTTVAAVELGGVRTYLAVPMLKDNELIGGFALCRQEVRPLRTSRSHWSRASSIKPSSPSKTQARRVIWRPCSQQCWRTLSVSATPSSETSTAGTASFCTSLPRTTRRLPSLNFASVRRFNLFHLSAAWWRRRRRYIF